MHLSSLFLSATALLSQTALADYLLFTTNRDFQRHGPARIASGEALANVGFYLEPPNPSNGSPPMEELALIHVDHKQDIGSKFLLRMVESGKFALLSKGDGSVSTTDVTQPFGTETDSDVRRFVYKGQEERDWVLCKVDGSDDDWNIHLVDRSVQTDCVKSDLSAIEF